MMKKVLIMFLTVWLSGFAQAGLVTFDFNDLDSGSSAEEIGSYMTDLYGSDVTVVGATTDDTAGGYIDSMYLKDTQTDGLNEFTISFEDMPISGLSFAWRRQSAAFYLDVIYEGESTPVNVFYDISPSPSGGSASGPGEWISFDDGLVNELIFNFNDSEEGFIGIDNLVVSHVPLPASILLGAFAVSFAGWKLRRLTLT